MDTLTWGNNYKTLEQLSPNKLEILRDGPLEKTQQPWKKQKHWANQKQAEKTKKHIGKKQHTHTRTTKKMGNTHTHKKQTQQLFRSLGDGEG